MRRLYRNSIQTRLFLLFLVSMTGILLIVGVLFYNRSSGEYRAKIADLSVKNSSQTVALLDLLLKGYDSLSKSITNNTDIIRLLSEKSSNPAVDYINERTITTEIGAIYYSREDLIGIHVISFGGKVINYSDNMSVVDANYADSGWYKRIRASSGEMLWFGVFQTSVIDIVLDDPVFAFGRLIYDLDNHRPIGMVLIESRPQLMLSTLDNVRQGSGSDAFILSDTGNVVPIGNMSALPDGFDGKRLAKIDDGLHSYNGDLVVTAKVPISQWTVVSRTPAKELNAELVRTQRYLLALFGALVIVSILIASLVARTISLPLRRVVSEMKRVETGNFNGALAIKSYLEIGQLADSFNRMVGRIGELIEQVKVSSVSEKNAELQALQSQVNPHFLYNTLDMIYWLLDEKGNDQLGEVVLALSRMFRYSSHWEEEATLAAEVEQTRHYLTIIQLRLKGRVTVDMNIDDRWLHVRLPKMTLQPIIENAVKYGLEPRAGPGTLRIGTAPADGRLHIVVEDDGVGMSAERLAALQRSLRLGGEAQARKGATAEADEAVQAVREREPRSGRLPQQEPERMDGRAQEQGQGGGIGLLNVQRRLVHKFGSGYGLRIESEPGAGTRVVIALPLPIAMGGS